MSQATAPQARRERPREPRPAIGIRRRDDRGLRGLDRRRKRRCRPDAVMPMVSTLLLLLAGAFGADRVAPGPMDPDDVTYRDVAGALTLIGLCAAATIDSDQMMRLVQLQTGRAE